MFISKIVQSVFLNIFHFLTLWIIFRYERKEPPVIVQRVGMFSLIISITFEYMFLAVDIIYTINLVC